MRVRVFPADQWGCGHYRLIWPARALADQGADVVVTGDEESDHVGMRLERNLSAGTKAVRIEPGMDADVFVFQRPTRYQMMEVIQVLATQRCVVIDMDDDLTCIHPKNVAFQQLHPKTKNGASWRHASSACQMASWVTVSTPGLVDRYGTHGRVSVLPNYVPESYLKVERPPEPEIPRWGWAGALHSHPDDVPILGGVVNQLRGRFEVVGNPTGIGRVLGMAQDPPGTGTVPFAEWPHHLAQLSVGVAPLADTVFNARKSWLKPLEYAAVGTPWVASPRDEYKRLADLGPGGQVVRRDSGRDWAKSLRRLLQDRGFRIEQGEAARATAAQLTIEGNAERWWDAWSSAYKNSGPSR